MIVIWYDLLIVCLSIYLTDLNHKYWILPNCTENILLNPYAHIASKHPHWQSRTDWEELNTLYFNYELTIITSYQYI